ncbi:threonine ammonia-lyase [Granulosicoccus antarcticus]|uniref:Phenylserine dehydratase n=1 Tax=Granulosicoccus antarcticus IMCC3135 TaxID=1192854 RepID=A0A2Z2P923_9GAMM|nr:pyridoxal-phosphate dependent enzyme [Granulosicoccus antarcticus]ASJ76394.1 Phenylserine dehydratase [Granulosicoccus antarcticus IMCC3135]
MGVWYCAGRFHDAGWGKMLEFAGVRGEAGLREVAERIAPYVLKTPTVQWPVPLSGPGRGEVFVKLELLQRTGSFKARGTINAITSLLAAHTGPEPHPGVTAFSAGNHAIATAYAAAQLGTTAKVVMPRTANPIRVERVRALGAELVFGDTISDLYALVEQIQNEEGRALVHPFEGPRMVEGSATVGLELCDEVPDLDAVIVPIGGGGLISGIASAVHYCQPGCRVYGVEPEGANGMQQSLQAGRALPKIAVNTIADSLGAPMHGPFTFSLVQQYVNAVVSVSDSALRHGMRTLFNDMKLAAEPACAAALAALQGPLAEELAGKRVAIIACGSNIDLETYLAHMQRN